MAGPVHHRPPIRPCWSCRRTASITAAGAADRRGACRCGCLPLPRRRYGIGSASVAWGHAALVTRVPARGGLSLVAASCAERQGGNHVCGRVHVIPGCRRLPRECPGTRRATVGALPHRRSTATRGGRLRGGLAIGAWLGTVVLTQPGAFLSTGGTAGAGRPPRGWLWDKGRHGFLLCDADTMTIMALSWEYTVSIVPQCWGAGHARPAQPAGPCRLLLGVLPSERQPRPAGSSAPASTTPAPAPKPARRTR